MHGDGSTVAHWVPITRRSVPRTRGQLRCNGDQRGYHFCVHAEDGQAAGQVQPNQPAHAVRAGRGLTALAFGGTARRP